MRVKDWEESCRRQLPSKRAPKPLEVPVATDLRLQGRSYCKLAAASWSFDQVTRRLWYIAKGQVPSGLQVGVVEASYSPANLRSNKRTFAGLALTLHAKLSHSRYLSHSRHHEACRCTKLLDFRSKFGPWTMSQAGLVSCLGPWENTIHV